MWYALFIVDLEKSFPEELLARLRKLLSERKRMGKENSMEKPYNIIGIGRIREGVIASLSFDALWAPCSSLKLSHCDDWLRRTVFLSMRKTCDKQPASHGFRMMLHHPPRPRLTVIMKPTTKRIKRISKGLYFVKGRIQDSSRPRASMAQCIMAVCAVLTLIFGVLWDKLIALLEIIRQMTP